MPKITPEQIAIIRKNSGVKTKRELAFIMGLSIATVGKFYLKTKPEPKVEKKKPFKEDFEYPDDDDDDEYVPIKRPKAVYDQSPSPYGIANDLMKIKLTKRCFFDTGKT